MQKYDGYLLLSDWLKQIKIGEVAAICLWVLFNHQVPLKLHTSILKV